MRSRAFDEGVDHLLLAGLVEVDAELVAFYRRDVAVAELLMKDAVAARIERALRIARLDGVGLAFDERRAGARPAARRAIGLRALPARRFIGAGETAGIGVVAKADRAAIEAFIDHGIDMLFGQFGDE